MNALYPRPPRAHNAPYRVRLRLRGTAPASVFSLRGAHSDAPTATRRTGAVRFSCGCRSYRSACRELGRSSAGCGQSLEDPLGEAGGPLTTARNTMRFPQQGQLQPSASNTRLSSQAQGTHRDCSEASSGATSLSPTSLCLRARGLGTTAARSLERAV